MDTENTTISNPEVGNESENNQAPEKQTRWIGVCCIILFFVFSGWSLCPWYLWIVFALLALITLGGIYKWGQAVLGIILLIWGSSLFGGGESEYSSSGSNYEVTSSSDVKQSESERREIEREIQQLQAMQAEFQRAWDRGDQTSAKIISDAAERRYHILQQKNLTKAQRARLSDLFAL